jgi:D-alanyl-lipoteichoic acid acyltransferase DltB (MBOAT superfamily)
MLGAVYFAFQIYGDFSGYSDIAIGTSRLFGIQLMTNFRTPYFARDIAEFWRRWHISLSTWFRDYVYIPLGGSRGGKWQAVRNTTVIFLVSGLWHGANWTFVAWGAVHALLFLPLLLLGRNRRNTGDIDGWPSLRELAGIATTFAAVCIAWVFFRADSLAHAGEYLAGLGRMPSADYPLAQVSLTALAWMGVTVGVDALHHRGQAPAWWLQGRWPRAQKAVRWAVYGGVVWLCLKNLHNPSDFIYFQF